MTSWPICFGMTPAAKRTPHATPLMNSPDITVSTCNLHLRGEISAIDAYTHAIEIFSESACTQVMGTIRSVHHRNADALRKWVLVAGAKPSSQSGLWSAWIRKAESATTWFGETSTLKRLQREEERDWKAYQRTLKVQDVSARTKLLIQDELIPHITANIIALHLHRARLLDRAQRPQRWRSPANDDSDSE